MPQASAQFFIKAPVEIVFDVIAHVENFQKAVPHIINIEYLTPQRKDVGTRFKETRLMKGREASTTLEVTEYELNKKVRIVADEGGTIWDSVFHVERVEGGTQLDMSMNAKPHKLLAKIVTPLIMGMLDKAVKADMNAIKDYCEALAAQS